MEKVIYLSFAQSSMDPTARIDYPLMGKNVTAVMIRGGQGIWVDPLFWQHYNGCLEAGIPFGIWWFCQPNMAASLQVEAFMKLWNSLPVKPVVIAYDVEEIDYYEDVKNEDGTVTRIYKKLFPPSRQFSHDNTLSFCKQIAALTGAKVGIYTRKNYFETWTFETSEWYQFWMWIAAWFLYTGEVKPALPWKWPTYKIHQYEGGGLGTPGVDPISTCKEYFNGTHQECLDFFKGKETAPMGKAYAMDPALCGRAITITSADARATISPKDLGVNTLIIRAGGSTGPSYTAFQDTAWDNRQKAAEADGAPVTMLFELDPAWYRANQVDEGMVKDRSGDPSRQPVLLKFLQCLNKNGAATWEMMKAAKPSDWRNVQAVMFSQFNEAYQGINVGEVWFSLSITDIINQVKALMDGGKLPALPIVLQTAPSLLAKYQGQLAVWLAYKPSTVNDAPARNSWLWLAFGGKEMWTLLPAHSDIPNMADCWHWALVNIDPVKYTWTYIPDGYAGRVLFHELSKDRLFNPAYTDSAGANRPLTPSISPSLTGADLAKLLGKVVVTPPPVEPPPTGRTLAQVDTALQSLEKQFADLRTYLHGA